MITASDVNRVIKDSIYNQLDDNYELVTMVPIEYKIDHEQGIRKPIGKKGQKLEIKGIMVSTPKKNIYSVLSVLEGAGLEVVDITITGLTNYHEVRDAALDKKDGASGARIMLSRKLLVNMLLFLMLTIYGKKKN